VAPPQSKEVSHRTIFRIDRPQTMYCYIATLRLYGPHAFLSESNSFRVIISKRKRQSEHATEKHAVGFTRRRSVLACRPRSFLVPENGIVEVYAKDAGDRFRTISWQLRRARLKFRLYRFSFCSFVWLFFSRTSPTTACRPIDAYINQTSRARLLTV